MPFVRGGRQARAFEEQSAPRAGDRARGASGRLVRREVPGVLPSVPDRAGVRTLYAISRVFVLWQPGWELVVFPLMLLAEVFLFKRWCSSICPLGFFFGLMTRLRSRLGFAVAPQSKSASCRAGGGLRRVLDGVPGKHRRVLRGPA